MPFSIGIALLLVYLAVGILCGLPFVFRAVNRMDTFARDGSLGFRLAILPGVVALWPWALWRWSRGSRGPVETNAHRRAASGVPGGSSL